VNPGRSRDCVHVRRAACRAPESDAACGDADAEQLLSARIDSLVGVFPGAVLDFSTAARRG